MVEAAECLLDFGGIKNGIDGGSTPFWFKNNPVFENWVILEVEADTQIVKVAAELKFVFATFEAVSVAEIEKFALGDIVASFVFEDGTDTHPGFG